MANADAREALKALYTKLEEISAAHEELTDTDVREAIHLTLNYFFVWGNEASKQPRSFGMFSEEGDREVGGVLDAFLKHSAIRRLLGSIPVGKQRLQFLQDESIVTPGGRLYDEFIGDVEEPLPNQELPRHMIEQGEYDYD